MNKSKIKNKETEILEFKKSTSEMKDAVKSIVAILNKHGSGKLIFGVNSKGKVLGLEVSEKTLRDISQKISNSIEPKIFPKVYVKEIENKTCIVVEFSGEDNPYYAFGRAYLRVADEDKQMSANEIEKFILEKNKDSIRWDYEICKEASLRDIDSKRLKWFLKEGGKEFESIERSIKKLKLMKNGNLLNSAILLFGKKPQKFFQNVKLRCAVFGSEDTSIDIDMKEFEGNIFELIENAEKYFLENIHIGMKLEGLKRIDIPEINKGAFREAIINAFCHRDYFNPDSVHLAIFKDRVEIRSPGLLFGGLTIERIRNEKVSERRNELIAQMLHLIHFVENWGKGISKILKLEPKTEFKEIGRKFYTVFMRNIKNVLENAGKNAGKKERQSLILEKVREGKFNQRIFAEEMSVNKSTIERDLRDLRNKIKFVGSKKGGKWILKNE